MCNPDYAQDQLAVWTAGTDNNQQWQDMVQNQYLLIAELNSQIVGFCSLDKGSHIDFLYTHKDRQDQGIASALYEVIQDKAKRLGAKTLTADVSITAKPFFNKMGFEVAREQTVVRNSIAVTNFKMKKKL